MRNYENFIEAYTELNADQFVPHKFVKWAGISALAGALERKVWLPWTKNFSYYPNMYILLVSYPGIGKSSAINPAVKMLRDLSRMGKNINFIPGQVTEAKLIELMANGNSFEYGSKIVRHCSGYYAASEASAQLRDLYGNFINTITSFYDCDEVWEKATVSMGDSTLTLVNVCFNLIAGCTFDYLGKLITDDNIMGGFASRCNYIIQKEAVKRISPFQNRGIAQSSNVEHHKLMEDLAQINSMTGPFSANEDFAKLWEEWFPRFDQERQALESEKLQALMVRKSTIVIKLCMILSAAESSDRILKAHHWHRAMDMTDEIEQDLPDMLREGASKQTDKQQGLNAAIFKYLNKQPNKTAKLNKLEQTLLIQGFDKSLVRKTIETFQTENEIFRVRYGDSIELLGNPNDYL